MSLEPSPAARPTGRSRAWLLLVALIAFAGAGGVAFTGITKRNQDEAALRKTAQERAIPTVAVAPPAQQESKGVIELPGRLDAFARAALFARVSGYIAKRNVDIGSRVKAGDVLAEIEAPDLDQQLYQAQSDLANAESNASLAKVTNERYQALLPNATVSQQSADEKSADLTAKEALVRSAQANLDRLHALSQFKRIVAPFDGIVTVRNTDIGALINTGSSDGSELFVISDTQKLRLYVNVPQNYVPQIKPGTRAKVTVPEHPGKEYDAKVEASSGAVDASSGTTRMQLIVDNAEGELMPGAYATVKLEIGTRDQVLSIPSSALIFDKDGLRVAVVGQDGTVALKTVKIARDLGKTIEIASGLLPEDRVIESPPDGIDDGDKVRIKAPDEKKSSQPTATLPKEPNKG